MSNLAKNYTKNILKRYSKLPVYFPGEDVNVGDILSFGTNIIGKKSKPYGEPQNKGKLSDYGIVVETVTDPTPDPLNIISASEVTVTPSVSVEVMEVVGGDIEFTFSKSDVTLMLGKNMRKTRMKSQLDVQKQLLNVAQEENWEDYYIITSVTVCEKALIYHSLKANEKLTISVKGNGLKVSGGFIEIGGEVSLVVEKKSNASFGIDWTDNVTLFMQLVKVKKNQFVDFKNYAQTEEVRESGYSIEEVSPLELLEELSNE